MKSNRWFLAFLVLGLSLLGLPFIAQGQDVTTKQLIISLPEGGFVSFKNQTAWTDLRRAFDSHKLPAALGSQAVTDHNQTIHRVLRDNDGKLVFGYDLWINGDPAAKQFKISVKPLDSDLQNALRANDQTIPSEGISTFPKPTELQILDDGAEFSLDLLINNNTGVKIIDVVKVTFDRLRLENDAPRMRPRDFTLDAVALEMKDYSLLVNDNLIATSKSKLGCAGTLLWIYIPHRGRFIFSLFPREGYSFQKSGTIAGNKIEFTIDGDHYEWLSSSAVLREEGAWNLWVLRDTQYSPLLAVREPPAEEKSTLEKLNDRVKDKMNSSAAALKQLKDAKKPGAFSISVVPKEVEKTPTRSRDVVMIGGADRIENLLPRN